MRACGGFNTLSRGWKGLSNMVCNQDRLLLSDTTIRESGPIYVSCIGHFAHKQECHHCSLPFIQALRVLALNAGFAWTTDIATQTKVRRSQNLNAGSKEIPKFCFVLFFLEGLIVSKCCNLSLFIICDSMSFGSDTSFEWQ